MSRTNSIRIDPERGLNPCLMVCTRCGKDHSIGLMGTGGYKKECNVCGVINITDAGTRKCGNCEAQMGLPSRGERLREGEKVPAGICDDCSKKQEECDLVVAEGGIYWKCSKCGSAGALKASSELSKLVREKMNIEAPEPCGVDFEGTDNCPICGQQANNGAPTEA